MTTTPRTLPDDFDSPPPAPAAPKPANTFTFSFCLEGFPFSSTVTVDSSQLPALVKRLKAIGATPPPIPGFGGGGFAKKPRTKPIIDGEGYATCPDHGKRLMKREWGPSCPHKTDGEWCKNKFEPVSDDALILPGQR